MTTQTELLGLLFGVEGRSLGEDRKRIIREWPQPKNLTELRGFIGLLQFFRRFIRNVSHMATPLTNLTEKGSGIHRWNVAFSTAFKKLMDTLCN